MSGAWIAVIVALWLLVIMLGVIVLGLVRRQAEVFEAARTLLRAPRGRGPVGAAVGTTVAVFTGRDPAGQMVRSVDLPWPAVVLFISGDCDFCQALLGELRGLPHPLGAVPLVVASATGLADPHEVSGIDARVITGSQVADAFLTNASPYAFALDAATTVVASGVVNRLEQLRDFASRVVPRQHAMGTSADGHADVQAG